MTPPTLINPKAIEELYSLLKKEGLSFIIMGVAIWYFYGEQKITRGEQKIMKTEIKQCNESFISHMTENQNMLIRVIEENTMALEKLNDN